MKLSTFFSIAHGGLVGYLTGSLYQGVTGQSILMILLIVGLSNGHVLSYNRERNKA